MISPEKIEEWIKEVVQRPTTAGPILRIIANRLSELAARNEELLDENIALRSEKKVEEYESRIANLEYQVDLLKRQLGGQILIETTPAPEQAALSSLVLYTPQGYIIRVEFDPHNLESGQELAVVDMASIQEPPRLLVTGPQEELLLAFSSGRSVNMPVSDLPVCAVGDLAWGDAYYQEPVGLEELAFIQPIGRMALSEMSITASRRGYVKKARESFFEGYVAKNYIGTGARLPVDMALNLTFCQADDLFVLVSKDGYVLTMPVGLLPLSIEETFKLEKTDYVVAAFPMRKKPSVLLVTNHGKAVIRETGWLVPAETLRSRGQAVLSKDRRAGGVRIAGAGAAAEADWGLALMGSGRLAAYHVQQLAATGSLNSGSDPVVAFELFAEA